MLFQKTKHSQQQEERKMNLTGSAPKQKNLIYDVGMHKGQDTDFYLKKGFKVVGFEANPGNAEFCRKRFAEAIKEDRLTIVEGAIVDINGGGKPEKVKFYRNDDHSPWGSTNEDWAYRNEVMGTSHSVIQVDAVDFGECLQKFGVPYYLKADIVGSEMICLRTLLNFENKPDYISIRSEKVIFNRLKDEFDLFEKLGYDRFKVVKQDFDHLKIKVDGSDKFYEFEEGGSGTFGEETEGNWKNRSDVLKKYQRVFVMYWLFGDYSYLIQTKKGKKFIDFLERIFRKHIPGWYDTHAKHSSID